MMKTDVLICHSSKSSGVLLSGYLGSDKVFNVEFRHDINTSLKCAF